jgi:cytochrome c oxidase assembly factor CtaG
VQPWPSRARWPRWAMVPYLLFADVQNTVLSALLTFSERVIYPYYETVPRIAGITPLNDQVMAGVIMWVPGSIFFLIPGAMIIFKLLSARDLTDARAAAGSGAANWELTTSRLATGKGKGAGS